MRPATIVQGSGPERRDGERGQLLPVWALGAITVMALALFVVNYANIVRWQIRAQNAADAAASAAVSPVANGWNEIELELYASTIEELRIRYLNQAILNTLQGVGCKQTGSPNCSTDYTALVNQFNNAVNSYDNSTNFLSNLGAMINDRFEDPSSGAFETMIGGVAAGSGMADDTTCDKIQGAGNYDEYTGDWYASPSPEPTPGGANKGWSSVGCVNQADPAFAFTPVDVDNGNTGFDTPNIAEVVACKNVRILEPGFLRGSSPTFKAVGVAAFTVSPISESFNPTSPTLYQPPETYTTDPNQQSYYTVDFSGLTVNVNFYLPVPTQPYLQFNPFGSNTNGLANPNGPENCS